MGEKLPVDPSTFHHRPACNIDITHRCPLECLRCQRYTSFTSKGLKVTGEDMPLDRYEKIINHFYHINFCGQVSDPVHHPKFIEMLEMAYKNGNSVTVHHASAAKPESWYPKAWKANPHAVWFFGLDGLPDESDKYRKNQDGHKMLRLIRESAKYLDRADWQYIVFSYNEHHIEEARKLVADLPNIKFRLLYSSRWEGKNDPLKPKNKDMALSLRRN